MTADGSKVFFTTKDMRSRSDTDTSADIYEAEHLRRERHPDPGLHRRPKAPATATPAIRSPTQTANTGTRSARSKTAARSRSAAVGESPLATGSIYFLSPELLDGAANGTANQPNLYRAAPGQAPTSSPPSIPMTPWSSTR